ncbi:MAG TPA: hypothetical protein VJK25_00815 [Patescibacteria group bacterium]|nr:hypothetical protein [Patescibacteria group bacterium]
MKVLRKLIYFSLLLGFIGQAQAAGISVTPSSLYFEQTVGLKKSAYVEVKNLSAEPVIFNLYADEFEDQIRLEPGNFRLEPEESRKIKATVALKKAGIFATNISVIAQDLDRRKFNVSTGVKIPVQIKSLPAPVSKLNQLLVKALLAFSLLLIITLTVIVITSHKRKRWYAKLAGSVNLLVHHRQPWWKRIIKL